MGTYSGGSGTLAAPYLIADEADWDEIIATTADWNKYFKVTADIDFGGNVKAPIGDTLATKFSGFLDGQGYTFSNIVINAPNTNHETGLFGRLNSSVVKNLCVSGATVTGGNSVGAGTRQYTAVIAAQADDGSTIDNCQIINCVVTATQPLARTSFAGMVSGACHGNITNCTVSGGSVGADITAAGDMSIGGVAGYAYCAGTVNANGSIVNCTSTATVTHVTAGTSSGYTYINVGGIAGMQGTSNPYLNTISNCHFRGTITYTTLANDGTGTYGLRVGGVVGWTTNSTVSNVITGCSSITTMTLSHADAAKPACIGGIVGYIYCASALSPLDSCYANTSFSITRPAATATYVGGVVGETINGNITNCYAFGSFYDATAASTALGLGLWGGIAGHCNGMTFTNCYAVFTTYSDGGGNVGGAIGSQQYGAVTVSNCFWNTTTSGMATGMDGGATTGSSTGKTTSQLKQKATFSNYAFSGSRKWKMIDGMYPSLIWENINTYGLSRRLRTVRRTRYNLN